MATIKIDSMTLLGYFSTNNISPEVLMKTDSGRMRARRMYPIVGSCELCGAKAKDRHHINGDTFDNDPSNIMFVCRKCHMDIDGRLKNLPARYARTVKLPQPCVNCKQLSKPLRKGLCHTCNEYFRRNGHHRPELVQGSRVVTVDMGNAILRLKAMGISIRTTALTVGVSPMAVTNFLKKECHTKHHQEESQ